MVVAPAGKSPGLTKTPFAVYPTAKHPNAETRLGKSIGSPINQLDIDLFNSPILSLFVLLVVEINVIIAQYDICNVTSTPFRVKN